MSKNNKYLYLWIVQGRYSPQGWQDSCQSDNYRKAREFLKACQDASKAKHRLIKRRIPNPEYIKA